MRYAYFITALLVFPCVFASVSDDLLDAQAVFSLRKVVDSYSGPVLTARRLSDNALLDVGFGPDGFIDVAALENWLSGSSATVVEWYDQTGRESLVSFDPSREPFIAIDGSVTRSSSGVPALYFLDNEDAASGKSTFLSSKDRAETVSSVDYALAMVVELTGGGGERQYAGMDTRGRPHEGSWYRGSQTYLDGSSARVGGAQGLVPGLWRSIVIRNNGVNGQLWQGNSLIYNGSNESDPDLMRVAYYDDIHVGGSYSSSNGFTGFLSELIALSSFGSAVFPLDYHTLSATYWKAGPVEYNEDAILPQNFDYQVVFYNWLKSLSVQDVTLQPKSFSFDEQLSGDELADLYLLVDSLTTSRVTRAEPEWYVLDAGNGKGIEATGEVLIWHGPGSGYGGNPPRSWSNEPAYLYQLHIPGPGGSEGNPYYKDPAVGKRALVVAMVDMMMYHQELNKGNYAKWGDMYGKAFLGWAETYRWTKELLGPDERAAFEEGMSYFCKEALYGDTSPRAVNTNMDMFFIQGVADFYMAAENQDIKDLCLSAVKKWLFGYPDGELDKKHFVFKLSHDGGVFSPSGFIMEGDQPDVFYGGESIYQLVGALAAVTDRDTGEVDPAWEWLVEVVRRLEDWRLYQYFYDLGVAGKCCGGIKRRNVYAGGAGFSGRTGNGVPSGQAGEAWKSLFLADFFPDFKHLASYKDESFMRNRIASHLDSASAEMSEVYTGTPPKWAGWSPWTKKTTYLPPKGWYSRMKSVVDSGDNLPPVARKGVYYNKVFGGLATGPEYWSYKSSDGSTEWGFFMEAQPRQGTYGGWYGGKIETFWTDKTGIVIMNRHGKSGCDPGDKEDSTCWDNMDVKSAHHVWGRDELGNMFTTLFIRNQRLERPVVFATDQPEPYVSVKNIFNEPVLPQSSSKSGEQTGNEIQGEFSITNTVKALSNGVLVTHTLESDGSDELTELWASVPVFLRHYNPLRGGSDLQLDLNDTSIEYFDGSEWVAMPSEVAGDYPPLVETSKLRLGRDFLLGDGMQYVYILFDSPQKVRLSSHVYYDPYQTKHSSRTIHIDMHGDPGSVRTFTFKELSYRIVTSDSAGVCGDGVVDFGELCDDGNVISGDGCSDACLLEKEQVVSLSRGWNFFSFFVNPGVSDASELFSDPAIRVVRDDTGGVFFPLEFDTLADFSRFRSYAVYASYPAVLSFSGPVFSSGVVSLSPGWSVFAYSGSEPVLASELFSDPAVLVVRSFDGRVYYPLFGIDQLGVVNPGDSLLVYARDDASVKI